MKQILSIEAEDAERLMSLALSIARHGKPVSIAIVDAVGGPLMAKRMDGASADTLFVAIKKAASAVRGGKDTVEFGHRKSGGGGHWTREGEDQAFGLRTDENRRTVNPDFVSWAGGVIITAQGKIVGGLAVSGLDQLEDHKMADSVRKDWEAALES